MNKSAAALLNRLWVLIRWYPGEVAKRIACRLLYCPNGCSIRQDFNKGWLKRRHQFLDHQRWLHSEYFRITVYRADGTASGPGA